ncbi:HpcH/HpaI aldolase/citrate lyase family protein [Actinokineospora guangxiensis]|uniref:HpcH/HpaI aldolase/citrate lyase family protein n=1 Tax=Actinokineospora guangxiensis TaxID=1490288 RepID=A0ABW0EXT1_9PSEU
MTPRQAPRSWLYVPAHDSRKVEKARGLTADAIILDMEDGTPADRKQAARDVVAAELARPAPASAEYWVRINAVEDGTGWADDIAVVVGTRAVGVVVPKADTAARVAAAAERAVGLRVAPIVTETAAGVLAMPSTLSASPKITTAFWGTEDLHADLGTAVVSDEDGLLDPFRVVRALFLVHCAAAGIAAVDTPCLGIGDLDAVARDSRRASRLGFSGKQVIHPSHVDGVNAAFLPTDAEVARAEAVVAAFGGTDGGAYRVADSMVDQPHLRSARRVLARAATWGAHA